jgi:hypothetical protein
VESNLVVLLSRIQRFLVLLLASGFLHEIVIKGNSQHMLFCAMNRVGKANKKKLAKDSDMPKRPPSAYLVFM